MQPQGLDLIDIIHKGAIATYPLILLSIISLTVVFERLWSLRNLGAITLRVTESILEPVKKGQRDLAIAICKQNSNRPVARIFLNILERESSTRLGSRQQHRQRSALRRNSEIEEKSLDPEAQSQAALPLSVCSARGRNHQILRKYGDRRNRRVCRRRCRHIRSLGGDGIRSRRRNNCGHFL